MPVMLPPAAMTMVPSSTLTAPARAKSVFFQPSRLWPSKSTSLSGGTAPAWYAISGAARMQTVAATARSFCSTPARSGYPMLRHARITCPECGHGLQVRPEHLGRQGRCRNCGHSFLDLPVDFEIPGYQILGTIAEGAMSTVFQARQ